MPVRRIGTPRDWSVPTGRLFRKLIAAWWFLAARRSVAARSTPKRRNSRVSLVYSVTWTAIRWLSFESRVEARRLHLRKGRIAVESNIPATRTTLEVIGFTKKAAIKRANDGQESLYPSGNSQGHPPYVFAIDREELLDVAEWLR